MIYKWVFDNIKGDGLDLSGSKISTTINYANNIKDKVLSIGEKSIVKASIDKVENSYLAAAIKDGSKAFLELNDIDTIGPNIMSYIKKSFYTSKIIFLQSN